MMRFFAEVFDPEDAGVPTTDFTQASIDTILQIVFAMAAGVALIVLVYAGLKYVLSRGEPAEVAKAKSTIIYAAIGLGVSVAAFSIVAFVVTRV